MNSFSTVNFESRRCGSIANAVLFAFGLFACVVLLGSWGQHDAPNEWYDVLMDRLRHGDRPPCWFIGSSRVAAAIDVDAFDRASGMSGSINLGQGYSTLVEHDFGLRNALALDPHALDHRYVFIEAPLGLPDNARWNGNWANGNWADEIVIPNLVKVLHASDLGPMWRQANMSWPARLEATASVLIPPLRGIARARYKASSGLDAMLDCLLAPLQRLEAQPALQADLANRGGIRTDDAGLQIAREKALYLAHRDVGNQQPIRDYEDSVLDDIVKRVQQAGGEVVLYEMPLSLIQRLPLESTLRQADRAAFSSVLEQWRVTMLKPAFHTRDDDFPDDWHLRRSRAPQFSERLAAAFDDWKRITAMNLTLGLQAVQGVQMTGLYDLERDGSGAVFRWTNGVATVRTWASDPPPGHLLVSLEVPMPSHVRVTVDGTTLLDEFSTSGKLSRLLPLQKLEPHEHIAVSIESDTFVPHQRDPRSPDERVLGVMLRDLKVMR